MALTTNPKVWRPLAAIFIALTAVFALLFYFYLILIVVVLGIIAILILDRIYADFKRNMTRFRFPPFFQRLYAIVLVFAWVFAAVFLLVTSLQDLSLAFLGTTLSEDEIQKGILAIRDAIPPVLAQTILTEDVLLKAQTYVFSLFSGILSQLSFIIVEGSLIIPLMVYTYFTRKEEIADVVRNAVPVRFRGAFERAAYGIGAELHDYLAARTTQSIALGSLYCLGFYIIGVKGWLVLGMLGGFLNIVPYLGPVLAAVAPFTVSLVFHDPTAALWSIVVILIVQATDHFYFNTIMVASRVKIDALLSLVVILAGAQLLGILGMVFAIPVYIIFRTVLVESYRALVEIYDAPQASVVERYREREEA